MINAVWFYLLLLAGWVVGHLFQIALVLCSMLVGAVLYACIRPLTMCHHYEHHHLRHL